MCDDAAKFVIAVIYEDGRRHVLPGVMTYGRAQAAAFRFAFASDGKERYEVVEVDG